MTSLLITSFTRSGNRATFGGSATVNGVPGRFTATVEDNGPDRAATFTLQIAGRPPEGGTLRSGIIQVAGSDE